MPLKYNNLSPIKPVGTDGEGLTFRYIQSLVHLCDQRGSETRYRVEPSGRRVTLQCRSGWVSAAAPGNVRQTARTKNRTRAQWFRHLQLMTHHHKHIHTWIKRTQPDTTQPLNTVSPPPTCWDNVRWKSSCWSKSKSTEARDHKLIWEDIYTFY